MLSNILGTLLAFVAIMLMLSLIVTGLVQFTQATLRLRGRNLLVGIAGLLQKNDYVPSQPKKTNSEADKRSYFRRNPHLVAAAHVLNNADAPIEKLAHPNSSGRVLMGPPISWIRPDDLAEAVATTFSPPDPSGVTTANAGADTVKEIKNTFESMQPAIAKRFQFIIRVWTVLWSMIIAFAFQVSAPELLRKLPQDDANRQAILAAVPNLTGDGTRALAFSTDATLEEALKKLGDKYPEYRTLFESVAGERDSKEDMMDEMRNVLGRRSNSAAVLSDYSSIIDSLSESSAMAKLAQSSTLIAQLQGFGFEPKLDDFGFYWHMESLGLNAQGIRETRHVIQWSHIVGVLITGILLTLGAPFWFEQLKALSGLRDAMAPDRRHSSKPAAAAQD